MQKKPLNLIFIAIIILFPKQSLTIESLAKTALVIDLSTNEVLLEKNSKAKTYPSSMTKMMTALVAFEKIKNGTLSLDQDQTEISEKLDYEKIKTLDIKNSKKQNTILVEIYKDINLAKLKTNKIKNLGLFYEENEEGVKVFAGPFLKSDINLKLDFLIKNGYLNAKKTP